MQCLPNHTNLPPGYTPKNVKRISTKPDHTMGDGICLFLKKPSVRVPLLYCMYVQYSTIFVAELPAPLHHQTFNFSYSILHGGATT